MYIDHIGINTNDMEATLQFYCVILGMRLVRTTRTPDGRRHYNVEIGGGNAFAVFDGAELPTAGERQHVNHLALPVDTPEEFDAAYQRIKVAASKQTGRLFEYRVEHWGEVAGRAVDDLQHLGHRYRTRQAATRHNA